MNVLSSSVAPSSFQIGIRALSRHPEKLACRLALRQFATAARGSTTAPCCRRTLSWAPSPARTSRSPQPTDCHRLLSRSMAFFKFRAITHYTYLPDGYEDTTGLPFRKEDLTQREVDAIFGLDVLAQDANTLLKILHGRRVAGTLDDPDIQINTANYKPAVKRKALAYLREHIPVDEVINAGLRAEDELRYLEEMTKKEADAPEPSPPAGAKSKKKAPVSKEKKPTPIKVPGKIPQRREEESVYGDSAFDRMRERRQAMREAEEKRLEEERIKREEEESLGSIGTVQAYDAQRRQEMSPWKAKYWDRAKSNLDGPPEMSEWERFWPMTAMAAFIVCCSVAYAVMFPSPPAPPRSPSEKEFLSPAAKTLLVLLALNTAIYILWHHPPCWMYFNRYLLLTPAVPRPLQILGSVFSHQKIGHLFSNMFPLLLFGLPLHADIGRSNFLALYFTSGALGAIGSMLSIVFRRGLAYTSLGASGAVYGIMMAYFWYHKDTQFRLFGYPTEPVPGPPGLIFAMLMLGAEGLALTSKNPALEMVDFAAHVMGMLPAIAGMEILRRIRGIGVEAEKKDSRAVVGTPVANGPDGAKEGVMGKAAEKMEEAKTKEKEAERGAEMGKGVGKSAST